MLHESTTRVISVADVFPTLATQEPTHLCNKRVHIMPSASGLGMRLGPVFGVDDAWADLSCILSAGHVSGARGCTVC